MILQTFWKPDVVVLVAPTLFCSPQVLCAARLSGAVTWIHVQDFELDAAFDLKDFSSTVLRRISEKIERALMRRFTRGSTISKNMLQRLVAKGVDAERSVYVPNWVDTSLIFPMEEKTALRRELGIADDKVVTLYSGTMGKKQGIETLVEVSQRMAQESHLQFVFCGDGPAQPALSEATRQASNVICLPLQPSGRLNELLNLADIHLLPQLAGAADLMMPSKLTGMMASGRPVLATAALGTEISAVLSERGILVPPGDTDAFASALRLLASNPELRKDLGDKARKYAVEHFEKDRVLTAFEAAMLEALLPPLLESGADRGQHRSKDQFQTEPVVLASHAADD
jgi:colanic acid biosynthesis glycosyl transferase WcaI